jgi:hypothetical protein
VSTSSRNREIDIRPAENERDAVDQFSRLLLDVMMLAKLSQVPVRFASVDSVQTLYA